ncbi:MAG: META domain-containing protein [Rhodospirillales bacterium]|nr:MAG: META domain-containing protein [Rhodospirillales bacterium]
MRWIGCAICAGVLALISCTAQPTAAGGLAGSEWRPLEIAGTEVPSDAGLFVQFGGAGKLQGHGGCNRFLGSYEVSAAQIEIGPLGATRMACPAPVMDQETRFLEALSDAKRFQRGRIDLVLTDAEGTPLARLIQTDAD